MSVSESSGRKVLQDSGVFNYRTPKDLMAFKTSFFFDKDFLYPTIGAGAAKNII